MLANFTELANALTINALLDQYPLQWLISCVYI